MKVWELIKQLEALPDEAEVYLKYLSHGYSEVREVEVDKDADVILS